MMTQGKEQTWWDSTKFTIDCVLANANRQLEADGCVLEHLEGGCKLSTPDHLKVGDFVKVQLWVEGEEPFINIRLAEVRRVYEHWIAVEIIQVSPNDRTRLKRVIDPSAAMHIEEPSRLSHLLIRA
ncbi:MAG: hypothetical protein ABI604_10245 [Nitrospirota bacterium]